MNIFLKLTMKKRDNVKWIFYEKCLSKTFSMEPITEYLEKQKSQYFVIILFCCETLNIPWYSDLKYQIIYSDFEYQRIFWILMFKVWISSDFSSLNIFAEIFSDIHLILFQPMKTLKIPLKICRKRLWRESCEWVTWANLKIAYTNLFQCMGCRSTFILVRHL